MKTRDRDHKSTGSGGGEIIDKLLLKPTEAAHVLGIGRTKLFELMASGVLKSVQIGHSRRVPRDAVDSFLAQLRAQQSRSSVELRREA